MDARQFGFNTFVIEDATKAIDLEGSLEQAWQQMLDRGVQRIRSDDLFKVTVQDE